MKTAITALKSQSAFEFSDETLKNGLLNVVKNTGLLGRWQTLQEEPRLICDTGHNKEGIAEIVQQLSKTSYNMLHFVWGMVDDKNVTEVLKLLPHAKYYFTQASIPRALEVEKLVKVANALQMTGEANKSVEIAVESALRNANTDDLIFVGGSTFVVADLLSFWSNRN